MSEAEKAAREIVNEYVDSGACAASKAERKAIERDAIAAIKTLVERAIAESQAPQPRDVSMQMLIDARLNAFGLQLFCESFADGADAGFTQPFSFKFRGLKFTVERVEGEEIDTRHH